MKNQVKLLIAAAFAAPLSMATPVNAAAEYCHTTTTGAYVCIQSVFGPRNNRGIVMSSNGNVSAYRINCYNYNYGRTSLFAVACWSYNALKAEPANTPDFTTVPESLKGIMTEGGFVSEDKAIDLDKVKNAFPPEMQ